MLGSAVLPAIFQGPCFSMAKNQGPHQKKVIYQRCAYHDIRHGEHHEATENHDEHHGILEHQHDAEGLMRNKVVVPLSRNEFDRVEKLDGRWRV